MSLLRSCFESVGERGISYSCHMSFVSVHYWSKHLYIPVWWRRMKVEHTVDDEDVGLHHLDLSDLHQ